MAPSYVLSIAILALVLSFYVARADPNISVRESLCNDNTYNPSDGYRASVQNVLADVISSTPNSGYSYYTSQPAPNDLVVYGHGACWGGLSSTDCYVCLGLAFPRLLNGCPYRIGAQIQLQDCRMRYEQYPFTE